MAEGTADMCRVRILFDHPESGTLEIRNGTLVSPREFHSVMSVEAETSGAKLSVGAHQGIVTVLREKDSFSFNLRDVSSETPIFIPEYHAAVVPGTDLRSYHETASDLTGRGGISDFARMENEPEENFEHAAARNRKMDCPVWLGLGRDMRIFHVSPRISTLSHPDYDYHSWGRISTFCHSWRRPADPETEDYDAKNDIVFDIGPGTDCCPVLSKRLEDGFLPILHAVQDNRSIRYELTIFVTNEKAPLAPGSVRGTAPAAAFRNTGGNMDCFEDAAARRRIMEANCGAQDEEPLCVVHIEAVNVSKACAYAWFKTACFSDPKFKSLRPSFHDGMRMLGNRVAAVSRINGKPAEDEEAAVLVRPGKSAVFEVIVPHAALPIERGAALAGLDYRAHLEGCRKFWRAKLQAAAKIILPERQMNERIQAGLLHMDLNMLGLSESGPLLAATGCYSPIGTESAPMIQFYDAVGETDMAERALDFFFLRQREDGFIQDFARYESETAPVLWTAAEHFRLTGDRAWLRRTASSLKKSCGFILRWIASNRKEEYRGTPLYGLASGKFSDPEEFLHGYLINIENCLALDGMRRTFAEEDPEYSAMLGKELALFRTDLLASLEYSAAHAPVIPFADGTWGPLMPPFAEYTGGISHYADGGCWRTHGMIASRSSALLHLGLTGLLPMNGKFMTMLLKANQHPATTENAALSQPYTYRHDICHLRRGEVKLFLKAFYNQLSAMSDPETYDFYEHYWGASEHKTHEEASFLMQIRWMLYFEEGETLKLLPAVPRNYFRPGSRIEVRGMRSGFGKLNLETVSSDSEIVCRFEIERAPKKVTVRLPHPELLRAASCSGGAYDPESETVSAAGAEGTIRLKF